MSDERPVRDAAWLQNMLGNIEAPLNQLGAHDVAGILFDAGSCLGNQHDELVALSEVCERSNAEITRLSTALAAAEGEKTRLETHYTACTEEIAKLNGYLRAQLEWAERVAKMVGHSEYASWPHTTTIENFASDAQSTLASQEASLVGLRGALEEMIGAIDAGSLEMSSPEIDRGDGTQPYRWHEEWLSHVQAALSNTPAQGSALLEVVKAAEAIDLASVQSANHSVDADGCSHPVCRLQSALGRYRALSVAGKSNAPHIPPGDYTRETLPPISDGAKRLVQKIRDNARPPRDDSKEPMS